MTTISTSHSLTRPPVTRRMVALGLTLALVATLCVAAIIAFGPGGSTPAPAHSTAASSVASPQYIGNHGQARANPFTSGSQGLPSSYEQQTPGPRP